MSARHQHGFTLIEMLIVTAIFSLTALVATTVVTRIQTTQRQILGKERVAADGRYILETIARAVRQGQIDYDYYRANAGTIDLTKAVTTLVVINQATPTGASQHLCYQFQAGSKRIIAGAGEPACYINNMRVVTPTDLLITNFSVWIRPLSDPYLAPPRQDSDCAIAPSSPVGARGFDRTRGVCACQAGGLNDCFIDQACLSNDPNKIQFFGNTCQPGDLTCICRNATLQPMVTISISTESSNQAAGSASHSNLQTTVTSHVYRP